MGHVDCVKCGKATDRLEVFPGDLCLKCYALSPAGRYMPSAGELATMWGGRA